MLEAIKTQVRKILDLYPGWICRKEFERQTFNRFNERPAEFSFVFAKLAQIYPRRILDVGTGASALPQMMRNCGFLVTATDNVKDYWPEGMRNRHFHVIDDDITNTRLNETFDLITSISVLEHIVESENAVRNMLKLLNPNGYLILTFPYTEKSYVRNVYELPASRYGRNAPYICQSYSRRELDKWLQSKAVILEQEYWQFWDGDYWTTGNQMIPPVKVSAGDKHQLTCILAQKVT
ncbi:class I SAM-dependent methyltransferase [Candidatus Poribacteria bacterium]|nr:class I SAM-dependent methyltransferase [Candidatus Poribacteria bacterium]